MSAHTHIGGDLHLREQVRSQKSFRNLVSVSAKLRKTFVAEVYVDHRTAEEKRKEALNSTKQTLKHFVESPIRDVLHQLGTDPQKGLSEESVLEMLQQVGRNELPKSPPEPLWKMFLEQFSDLLVLMLVVSSIVAMGLGEYAASVVIILIVMINAFLGVYQERKAGAALDALESLSVPECTVIRNGLPKTINSQELVPGDIVELTEGSRIPADIRLLETKHMSANEMPLTGESINVAKDSTWLPLKEEKSDNKEEKEEALTEKNMVYMGCTIAEGKGKGVVIKTGVNTKVGEIAKLMKEAEEEEESSPLQEKLHGLGVRLGIASITISIVVFIIGVTTGRGVDKNDKHLDKYMQMLLVAVSLTVAAVPEGLPACVTITLAIGMNKMVQKNALIRNLHSVETLGSASVICTDKTGTLTKGVMTAVRMYYRGDIYKITGVGYDPRGQVYPLGVDEKDPSAIERVVHQQKSEGNAFLLPFVIGSLSSNAVLKEVKEEKETTWECMGNTSERPLVVAAAKVGLSPDTLKALYPRLQENPFNSSRKMMSTLHSWSGDSNASGYFPHNPAFVACVKGAPNVLLDKCVAIVDKKGQTPDITEADKQNITKMVDEFSEQAFRVIGVAYQPFPSKPRDDSTNSLERDLVFVGLFAYIDPERPEVSPSIQKAYNAGIRTVMITGDYVKTAKAIAENVGILERGSPASKACDCKIIREIGEEEDKVEEEIKQAEGSNNKELLKKLKARRDELAKRVDAITAHADVFARAKPVDKITIVRSLQRQGHVCSMTGDGANDGPALKKADIGVAMGKAGVDVAKAAAAMVLLDDNFVSIVEAIEQGRTIYNNIQKFVFYLLSTNVSEVMFILIAVIWGYRSPLLPIQILWLNLTTDGAPAIALAVELVEPGIMTEGPRPRTEPILEKLLLVGIVIQNIVLTTCTLFTYILGIYWETGSWSGTGVSDEEEDKAVMKARTMCILYIVFAELFRAYSSRSLRRSILTLGITSNRYMQYAVFSAVALTIFIVLVPGVNDSVFSTTHIDGKEWGFVIGFCVVPFFMDELTKLVYRTIGFGERAKVVRPVANAPVSPRKEGGEQKDLELGISSGASEKYAKLQ